METLVRCKCIFPRNKQSAQTNIIYPDLKTPCTHTYSTHQHTHGRLWENEHQTTSNCFKTVDPVESWEVSCQAEKTHTNQWMTPKHGRNSQLVVSMFMAKGKMTYVAVYFRSCTQTSPTPGRRLSNLLSAGSNLSVQCAHTHTHILIASTDRQAAFVGLWS